MTQTLLLILHSFIGASMAFAIGLRTKTFGRTDIDHAIPTIINLNNQSNNKHYEFVLFGGTGQFTFDKATELLSKFKEKCYIVESNDDHVHGFLDHMRTKIYLDSKVKINALDFRYNVYLEENLCALLKLEERIDKLENREPIKTEPTYIIYSGSDKEKHKAYKKGKR